MIVLTGSHGFLGQHIIAYCQAHGLDVITVPHELLEDTEALKYKLRGGFDYLIHAAAYGNYYDQDDDFQTLESNIIYTHNLLQATKDITYKGIINVSTSSVYGRKAKPMDELDIIEPETLYAATKAAAELICKAFAIKYSKPIFSVRPFTMFGPGDNKKHLIPTIIDSIKLNQPINLDPEPVHDYIYVKDVVEAIFMLKDQGALYPGSVINIGSGLQFTNEQVLRLIEEIMNKQAKINYRVGLRSYDSRYWMADTRLLKFLGFTPNYTLATGLAEMLYEK